LTPSASDLAASRGRDRSGSYPCLDSAKSKIDLLPNNNSSCQGAAREAGERSVAGPLIQRSAGR